VPVISEHGAALLTVDPLLADYHGPVRPVA